MRKNARWEAPLNEVKFWPSDAKHINGLVKEIHQDNVNRGWWHDPHTLEPKDRNVGEMIALIHSELSEALEAHRKDLMDDKLPHRKGIEVELADAVIRIFDLAGGLDLDLGNAVVEKLQFNQTRSDHKMSERASGNGKKF
jgi:NTP pyrophosphatase (non-canonical NTP hydrolase)